MPLSERQEILFTSLVNLYKPLIETQGILDRDPGEGKRRYVEAYINVRCHWRQTVSPTQPSVVGALETSGHHTFSFAEDQEVEEGWYIMDVTPGVVTQHHTWVVESKPQRILKRGDRDAGQTIVQAMLHQTPYLLEPS